jgi:DNA-binding GntR family transcriptional regulator
MRSARLTKSEAPRRAAAGKPPVLLAATPKLSLGEEAYEALKWRILKMAIAPGTFINVQELADSLGLGRSPVHWAVLRLQHDGLLEVLPRKGIVVRAWTRRDVGEVLEARLPIEVEIARLAAQRAERDQVRQLRAMLAKAPELIAAGSREALMQLDRDFHQALAVCTGNDTLVEMQELLHQRCTPLWFITVSDRREYAQVQGEHEKIAARVAARDAEGAAAAMHAHLAGRAGD